METLWVVPMSPNLFWIAVPRMLPRGLLLFVSRTQHPGSGRGCRIEHLHLVGWRLYGPAQYVEWCGHGQSGCAISSIGSP
jgi:hypothetical protein